MKHHNKKLGQIFRAKRQEEGLSVPQLAAVTGLPLSTIYNFEKGYVNNPSFATVATLASAMQLSLDELVAAQSE